MESKTVLTTESDVGPDEDHVLDLPYVGLKGRALAETVHRAGPESVVNLGSKQVRYLSAICMRNQKTWPGGFFESNVDELMDRS